MAEGSALEIKGKIAQPKPYIHFDEGFQMKTETFKKAVSFGVPVVLKAPARAARKKRRSKFDFQACDARVCNPPKTVELPLSFTVAAGAARPDKRKADESVPAQTVVQTVVQADIAKGDDKEKVAADNARRLTRRRANGAATGRYQPVNIAAGATTTPGQSAPPNLFSFIALAFGAGLLAILTPCVFPMIPITVSLFSKQTEGNRFVGPLAYCGGIIGTFTLIGVAVSVLFGAAGLSLFAANPLVNIALATLFFVLALNLFGVFEIVVPASILNKVQPKGKKSGIVAPILMGFAFTLTSFTCTVPFVGTALVSAATAGPIYPAIGMLAFSTAFALPFFLLALFPSFLSRLPRSGQWLVSVKAFMGFLELAAALKFLQVADYSLQLGLLTRPIFLAIWFTIAVVAGFYLLRVVRLPNDTPQKLGPGRAVLGVATLGVAGWLLAANNGVSLHDLDAYLPPRDYGTKQKVASEWIVNDLDKARALAKSEGKPLLVNFTGYACTNCRLMENNVLPHPDVKQALGDFVAVELFTDGSDAKSREFNRYQQEKFGTVAIPLYAVMTPEGEIKGRLEGLERDPAKFTQFLSNAGEVKVAAR